MLSITIPKYYKVKKGQTLRAVAEAFCVPETRIAAENGLKGEITEGHISYARATRKNCCAAAPEIIKKRTARMRFTPA